MQTYKLLVPLMNFESTSSEIKLGKDFIIRKLSNYDKQTIEGLAKRWSNINHVEFLLECTVKTDLPESKPGEYIEKGRINVANAFTILRLFKEEIIGYSLIVQPYGKGETYAYSTAYFNTYQLWVNRRNLNAELFLKKYKISDEDVDGLKQFFAEFHVKDFKVFSLFSLAINYFNKSYTEPFTPWGSFLDLMISLENLYLKGENQELGYKLRVRMSHELAKEFKKRMEIFKDIKEAYKYRGRIVHGASLPKIDHKFLFKIRGYVRESLKLFMKHPSLRDNLDENVLKGIIRV